MGQPWGVSGDAADAQGFEVLNSGGSKPHEVAGLYFNGPWTAVESSVLVPLVNQAALKEAQEGDLGPFPSERSPREWRMSSCHDNENASKNPRLVKIFR